MHLQRQTAQAVLLTASLCLPALLPAQQFGHDNDGPGIHHVLLISIDGMHVVDFENCATGLPGVNGGRPYCPTLAQLAQNGVSYLDTSTSKPSDSFPGLMALVTGGSPRTVGAFYDVAYDRSLNPPAATTGNGVAGGPCTAGATPPGTRTEFDEGIDFDQTQLNGVNNSTLSTFGGGIASIDATKLPRDRNCNPIYPWNFVRTNTIFGVVHSAGGYTAWSDKHPSYSAVSGNGSNGNAVDDYYSPEINSTVIALPGVSTPEGMSCATIPDPSSDISSWTNSFQNIQCYDTLKVNAIVNEANGKTHDGNHKAKIPALFGMNFQAVSVGQKLIEKSSGTSGGYVDSIGTPSAELLSEIEFADASIGEMVAALKKQGGLNETVIIISAKHGQSPVDTGRYTRITSTGPVTTSPATILDASGCLPTSESPSNQNGIGPTEDDVSLIWLNSTCSTANAVSMLEAQSPASANIAGIGQIFWGPGIVQLFNAPGLPPNGDPRTPDILVTPNVGVTYSGSTKKQAEHGGFAHDDTNVMLLVSNPSLREQTVTSPVETEQIAPTILEALGLNPSSLQAVQKEGTQVLPGVSFSFFPF
jgi:Type I phosphodiesterase / nucleotide pyrophosphatase